MSTLQSGIVTLASNHLPKTQDAGSPPATVFDMVHAADLMSAMSPKFLVCSKQVWSCSVTDISILLCSWICSWSRNRGTSSFLWSVFSDSRYGVYFRLPMSKRAWSGSWPIRTQALRSWHGYGFSENILHNFHAFQTRVVDAYDRLAETEKYVCPRCSQACLWNHSEMRRPRRWLFSA